MRFLLRVFGALAVVLPALGFTQNSNPPDSPTVTFHVLWAAATPQEYTIQVTSAGSARYVSRNPTQPPDANGVRDEDYVLEFTMSEINRRRIFALAEQANFFNGQFDFKHKVADTGKKTLSYADSGRHFQTAYNYSDNAAIDQLTKLFSGISFTIEHGRKLQFLRRFDKLGLEAELKGMEEMAENQWLVEMQIITPTLENIANDSAILHIARQRAKHLLALAAQEASGGIRVAQ